MDIISYILSRKYTDNAIVGLGSIRGANCTIKDIVHQDGVNTVTFEWEGTDGTKKTRDMVVYDGTPIYVWESGNTYHYGDLAIYESQFYRCIIENSDVTFDNTKWNEIGSPDGNYDIVQSKDLLPARFTAADRKLYFVIDECIFYLWDGYQWVALNHAVQLDSFPVASEKYFGKIYQYIGATTNDYTHGYFYQCVSNGETPAVYTWEYVQTSDIQIATVQKAGIVKPDGETIQVDANGTISVIDRLFVGTQAEWDALTPIQQALYKPMHITDDEEIIDLGVYLRKVKIMPNAEDYPSEVVMYVGDTDANYTRGYNYRSTPTITSGVTTYHWEVLTEPIQFTTMPTASIDYLNKIVQYVGNTTQTYTNGFWYKCVSDGAASPSYSWVAISTQAKDYTELDNKPSINGQVLSGNKTSAQLNLATPREVRQFSTLNALTSYLASYVITNESLIYIRNYGTYYIITGRQSSDTEDDCIFVSDTQKLIPDIYHVENGLLPIKAFGALRSTNTIENSRLITKVINFASSHGMGVFIPSGLWYIKETIPVSNISIIGEKSSNVNAQASVTSSKLIFDPEQSNISMFTDSGAHSITLRHLTFECPYTTTNRSWIEVTEIPHDYITWSYQYDNVNCLDIRNSRLDIFDVNIRGFSGFGLSCNQALSIESVRIFNGKYGFYNCKTDVQFHDSFIQGCEVGFMWDNSGTVLFAYNTWIDQCKYGVYSAGELSGLFDGGEIDHCLYAGICAYSVTTGLTVRARFGRLGMYYIGEDMLEKAKLITTYTDADFEDMSKGVDIAIKYAHNVNIDIDETPKYISDSQTGTNTLPSLFMYGRALNNTIIKTVYDFGDHTYYVFDSANSNVCVINVNKSGGAPYIAGSGINITNNTISVTDRLTEVTSLPTASSTELDNVYLYLGSASGLKHGGIYQCVSDGQSTPTYSWQLISSAEMVEFTSQELSAMW